MYEYTYLRTHMLVNINNEPPSLVLHYGMNYIAWEAS